MRKELMDILVCPVTHEPLELVVERESEDGEVISGHLYSKSLDFRYPIEDGIPNLLPPEMQDGAGGGAGSRRA